jgi:Repeat of unknown function (DUF5648)
MGSTRKYFVASVVFAAVLFSTPSFAFFSTCSLFGTTTFAKHPHGEPLTVNISLVSWDVPPSVPVSLVRTTLEANNQIKFDVVLTSSDALAMFPDYQSDPVFQGQIQGTFGPLAVGLYAATTSVHIYDTATGFTTPCLDQTAWLNVYADDGLSPVIEYYNSTLDHYFITQDTGEIAALDTGVVPGWARTGQSFLAYRPGDRTGQRVWRFYGLPSAGLNTHFFTMNGDEISLLTAQGSTWELESSDAFDLDFAAAIVGDMSVYGYCPPGELPVYRLWNQRVDSNHRFTTDPAIKAQMIAKGYVAEGYGPDAVMMCAFTH